MSSVWQDQGATGPLIRSPWFWAALAILPFGLVFALLTRGGLWWLAPVMIAAVYGFIILHRRPILGLSIWILLAPFVITTEAAGVGRKGYWLVHRALPVVVLAIVLIGGRIGVHRWRNHRLGVPEMFMVGYLAITLISVWYTSIDALANTYRVYDWIFIPMCLYLLVRLLQPDESSLQLLMPALAFFVISQAAFGILQWVQPEVLPDAWLNRAGERTTGSLQHPNVYGVTLLFASVLLLNAGGTLKRVPRWLGISMFAVASVMVVLTLSRAAWLAGLLLLVGLAFLYPTVSRRALLVAAPLVVVLALTGLPAMTADMVESRLSSAESDESALSRLPVALAQLRMVEAKPLFGWGYENFDRYDRQFQSSVFDLVVPEKDHASHNVYLTILAEQGIVGFALFIAPALWWLVQTPSALRHIPRTGFVSRKLLISLWLVVLAFVVISNFSNMRVAFGLGMWWVLLGLIGSIIARYRPTRDWRGREISPDQRPFRELLMDETGMKRPRGA